MRNILKISNGVKILRNLGLVMLMIAWLMTGWPAIWHNPRIPPLIKRTDAATTTKFYLHNAASPDTGTLPGASTLSATTPNVTATGASTNLDMDIAIGTAQVSQALTTLAVVTLQKNWFRRFLSKPLAAQTLTTGIWTIQGGASESSLASNLLLWGAVIKVWRPSTGAAVATLLDSPTLGSVEPGTTETNISKATASITGVAINDGDILVVELWGQNTQGNTTARTNTVFYDGTTEASITSNAAFLLAPGAITMQAPTFNQSAYRLFNNLDFTDVGTTLAAQDTAATLGSTGAAFRLRMLLHIALNKLFASDQTFKLQFAQQSGTCDTGFVGETYADVTAATVIAYNNNATPVDGATLTANASDPTHGADTIVNQTYEELNNFTNSFAAIPSGQDGKWDFSLKDNGATASTAYCLRALKSDGTVLNTYTQIPQITTAAAAPAQTLTFSLGANSLALGTLSTTAVTSGSHTISLSTNAGSGMVVTYSGPTLTSGANTITAMATAAASSAGTEQFGLNAVANTSPSVGAACSGTAPIAAAATGYATANNFKFVSGETIVSSAGSINSTTCTISYIANITNTTEAGSYTSTLTYIATATF